jgi:hypothetical protein
VQEKHGVNQLAAMCAIDRATLVTVCDYWAPGVGVTGITELVVNAMKFTGQKTRTENLRLEQIPGWQVDEPEEADAEAEGAEEGVTADA